MDAYSIRTMIEYYESLAKEITKADQLPEKKQYEYLAREYSRMADSLF